MVRDSMLFVASGVALGVAVVLLGKFFALWPRLLSSLTAVLTVHYSITAWLVTSTSTDAVAAWVGWTAVALTVAIAVGAVGGLLALAVAPSSAIGWRLVGAGLIGIGFANLASLLFDDQSLLVVSFFELAVAISTYAAFLAGGACFAAPPAVGPSTGEVES